MINDSILFLFVDLTYHGIDRHGNRRDSDDPSTSRSHQLRRCIIMIIRCLSHVIEVQNPLLSSLEVVFFPLSYIIQLIHKWYMDWIPRDWISLRFFQFLLCICTFSHSSIIQIRHIVDTFDEALIYSFIRREGQCCGKFVSTLGQCRMDDLKTYP